jgi:hypothetical protein
MAQITKVTAITASGVLLPYQLIFGGKTDAVHPKNVLPAEGSIYSQTPSHFTVAATQMEMVQSIIIPYVDEVRQELERQRGPSQETQRALLIWDGHATHSDSSVVKALRDKGIHAMILPANCTSKYQPLDVLFNSLEKRYLTDHFSEWHIKAFADAIARDPDTVDVIPTQAAAAKRSLIAALIRAVHEKMRYQTHLITKAWIKSGLLLLLDNNGDDVGELGTQPVDQDIINTLQEVIGWNADQPEAEDTEEEVVEEEVPEADPGEVDDAPPAVTLMEDDSEESLDEDDRLGAHMEEDSNFLELSETELEPRRQHAKRKRPEIDDAASEESCQKVEMRKHPDGRHVELTYLTSHRPSPSQLLEMMMMKAGNPLLANSKIMSESTYGDNRVLISLAGCDRTSLLDGGNLWAWMPQT